MVLDKKIHEQHTISSLDTYPFGSFSNLKNTVFSANKTAPTKETADFSDYTD